MQKAIDNNKEVIQDQPKHKGKKKKRVTDCSAKKRQYGNCAICGSDDVVFEVLIVCDKCGKEKFELRTEKYMFFNSTKICDCKEEYKYRHKIRYTDSRKHVYEIANCNTCGAYRGPLCPNCKKPIWYKFDEYGDKRHCTGLWSGCGFRVNI